MSSASHKRQRTDGAAAAADSTTRADAHTTKTRLAADGTVFGTDALKPPDGLYTPTVSPDFTPNTATTFANVTAEHVRGYADQGFLVIEDAFSPSQAREYAHHTATHCT